MKLDAPIMDPFSAALVTLYFPYLFDSEHGQKL